MDRWHGIMLLARTMRIAITLSLVAGGFVFVNGLKQRVLTGMGGGTGLLAGAGDGAGPLAGMGGGNGLLPGLTVPGQQKQPWSECPLPHPGNTPALTLMQRGTHPPQVNYQCQVRFGDGAGAVCRWLPLDCGGRIWMNAYWYPSGNGLGPCIRLQDYLREYLLDLDKRRTYLLLRYAGQVFAGEISESNPGYLTSTSRSPGGKPEIHVYVGGNQADNISHTVVAYSPGAYFGGIDGQHSSLQFVPASEAAEH